MTVTERPTITPCLREATVETCRKPIEFNLNTDPFPPSTPCTTVAVSAVFDLVYTLSSTPTE